MRDTSFVVAPIRDHAFFKQAVFQRQVRHALLQRNTLRDLPDFEALEDAGLLSKEQLLAGDILADVTGEEV